MATENFRVGILKHSSDKTRGPKTIENKGKKKGPNSRTKYAEAVHNPVSREVAQLPKIETMASFFLPSRSKVPKRMMDTRQRERERK